MTRQFIVEFATAEREDAGSNKGMGSFILSTRQHRRIGPYDKATAETIMIAKMGDQFTIPSTAKVVPLIPETDDEVKEYLQGLQPG